MRASNFFRNFRLLSQNKPSKGTQTKSYENSSHQELRDPKDVPQITRNPTQKTELESETDRARNGSQQHRVRAADSLLQYPTVPWTVCYSTSDSPQVKNLKTNFAEAVLFSTEKQLLHYRGQFGLGGRTVREYGHRAAMKAQKKISTPGLSATVPWTVRESRNSRNRELRKSPPLFDLPICDQIFTNCHET
jgi:hypothetical protein